jgi:hypothetical protein
MPSRPSCCPWPGRSALRRCLSTTCASGCAQRARSGRRRGERLSARPRHRSAQRHDRLPHLSFPVRAGRARGAAALLLVHRGTAAGRHGQLVRDRRAGRERRRATLAAGRGRRRGAFRAEAALARALRGRMNTMSRVLVSASLAALCLAACNEDGEPVTPASTTDAGVRVPVPGSAPFGTLSLQLGTGRTVAALELNRRACRTTRPRRRRRRSARR